MSDHDITDVRLIVADGDTYWRGVDLALVIRKACTEIPADSSVARVLFALADQLAQRPSGTAPARYVPVPTLTPEEHG